MKVWVLQSHNHDDSHEMDTVDLFTSRDNAESHLRNSYTGANIMAEDDWKTLQADGSVLVSHTLEITISEKEVF